MTIIFYDIPSSAPGSSWSPNTRKARYVLNYKGIPYKTEWVEFSDIESHCKKLGILPTSTKRAGGGPHYTLPAIHDPSTGAYISESTKIAEYLEKTYPDTPTVFPHNTIGLQWPFNDAYTSLLTPFWMFILPATFEKLHPVSQAYYRTTREAFFGKKIEELMPTGDAATKEWANCKEGLGKVSVWFEKTDSSGPYLLGDRVSWGDFVVASYLVWMRIIWGEDSKEWKDISSWDGGRWKRLVESLKEYETVV
ncbi:hypothetical protein BDN70DRAFT_806127 [Pholiota conissans]|uniref:GST N-terminal domain-containing protein n=1 Tax=Pholiota conissans TaxID=109636 RepID=A0A9P6D172_9AGAR|nr:hypothetical protein BDN70DRAFT_806127 [Pholiota conissans]